MIEPTAPRQATSAPIKRRRTLRSRAKWATYAVVRAIVRVLGYFLIGLSAVDIDVQRNIELLKNRDWFDIPIVYSSGKRGILAMEKGTPGARAFEEAFRAWGE